MLGGGGVLKRLNADGEPQIQKVSIGEGSVTWLRGGSAIEINAATLEVSTDKGTSWNPPIIGRRVDGGWLFVDASISDAGTYALRLRGIATVGRNGTSSMIVETLDDDAVDSGEDDQLCFPIKIKNNKVVVICL